MTTEWDYQESLTAEWIGSGLRIGGRQHFLVAWEVMAPSWKINDYRKHWSEPSADFLLADRAGRLTVAELKRRVSGRSSAWDVLCQVTRKAMLLGRTFRPELLESAHEACWTGRHGRVSPARADVLAAARHQAFFALAEPVKFTSQPMGRAVAAYYFGADWLSRVQEFADTRWDDIALAAPVSRESSRLVKLDAPTTVELATSVKSVLLDSPAARGH